MGFAELSAHGLVRVCIGINPNRFEWELKPGESFETPQAVMTCSDAGFIGLSARFHDFVNAHIIPKHWQGKERPVLYNSWEACFFKYTQRKLLRMARIARGLGAELFVLDDGWFGARNSDSAGLGDYNVNRKKLRSGLQGLAKRLRRMGLEFGLWFEPEMVNKDSELYRANPDWAVRTPGRPAREGRNQLVLDLCKPEVRDYIVKNVGDTIDSAGVSYVKWDMNRHISDAFSDSISNQGEFFHRYILGLYEVLKRIFAPRPHILLETCSSGGNRFDLGMLSFGPQAWASDCTDPLERLGIQGGLSYLYPQSALGAHVSDAPHQQTLRDTPLSTRFNVAAFGVLGYELDLRFLTKAERTEIKRQIGWYKTHRAVLQFGRFRRVETGNRQRVCWQASDSRKTLSLNAQLLAAASPGREALRITGLDGEKAYRVSTKPQCIYIKRFGGLVKHILPFALNPNGIVMNIINRVYALPDCVEAYTADGAALAHGIELNNQFMGSYYNPDTRLLGDFGSNIYIAEEL
jgi:alpha-galactosidase